MTTEKKPKKAKKYVCEFCDYNSCKISNYNAHLATSKHQKHTSGNTLETFCPQEKKYICKCGEKKHKTSDVCLKCSKLNQRKVDRPTINVLLEDVKNLGYKGTGRKYGVSDNAIRKWLK